ncbi:MAG TPA: hypothetical protein DIT05_01030 [Morganella sp. (in: Bacteria)]|nr:hypothetical protein [Morganella sp. (in: enterobacteria)]
MKELNANEINAVSGAGRLQDTLTSLGNRIGTSIGGEKLGTFASTLGNKIGGRIETTLKGLPVIGKLFGLLLG